MAVGVSRLAIKVALGLVFKAVQQTLVEFDARELRPLTSQLSRKNRQCPPEGIKKVGLANATDYAQFAKELVELEPCCPTAKTSLSKVFKKLRGLHEYAQTTTHYRSYSVLRQLRLFLS
ncbi:hypothetical protein OH492_23705 [Vibrio chagasii]|nr:hypothetical protein [Vibrio chagasii]